jgi:hypothetical protein
MKNTSPILAYRQKHGKSLAEFGELFDPPVNRSTVQRWENGQFLTPKRAIQIEAVTGIKRHLLLPDIFAVPQEAAE